MTAVLLQNLKLIMLFLLVGSIIGLSHFAGENRNGSALARAGRTSDSIRAHKILVVTILDTRKFFLDALWVNTGNARRHGGPEGLATASISEAYSIRP